MTHKILLFLSLLCITNIVIADEEIQYITRYEIENVNKSVLKKKIHVLSGGTLQISINEDDWYPIRNKENARTVGTLHVGGERSVLTIKNLRRNRILEIEKENGTKRIEFDVRVFEKPWKHHKNLVPKNVNN